MHQTRTTGTSFYLAELPSVVSVTLEWFRQLTPPPEETPRDRSTVLFFEDVSPLVYAAGGNVDELNSPLVVVDQPRTKREVFWTLTRVSFLPTRSGKAGGLERIKRRYRSWLNQLDVVYRRGSTPVSAFDYYLEGSARNVTDVIWATPEGLEALRGGRYFIGPDTSEAWLDTFCRQLALRGISCGSGLVDGG